TPDQQAAVRAKLRPKFTAPQGMEVAARVTGTTTYDSFADVDLAIEAVFESATAKRTVFEALDAALPEGAVLASNTSSLSVTALARGLHHAPETLVLHFFNPPSTLPLVEVSAGVGTREDIVTDAVDLLQGMRNHRYPLMPIRVREAPGFVVNRILGPLLNEACFVLEEGIANARDIDSAMKAGAGVPMGPFELADWIGLDVSLEVVATLHRELGEKYRPNPMLRRLVAAGHLGRKTGRGFYEYIAP
ncbi:MAG: 3-hydroxyacyl-CoA dehydrogenase family protein, partial [Thermoplasmata archaeon]|nr:3-hydroxyacyl-CoA dehydrogenase family protein [Thermoplasmata archaeon]